MTTRPPAEIGMKLDEVDTPALIVDLDSFERNLRRLADRVQGGANSVRDEAAKIGSEAAKLGNHALRRVSSEVEHRPLVTLAVAIGVGILVGLASHYRASPQRPPQRRRR